MKTETVDTLLISDIHLGSVVSRAAEALDLLQSVNFKRLILLGDIFSDLDFSRLTSEHWKFLGAIRKLSNPKRRKEVIWVEGNHDMGLSNIMSHLVGVPVYKQFVWEYAGKRHLAIHGHQFDRFVVNNEFLSRVGEWWYYQLQKLDQKEKRFVRYLDRLNTRWLRLTDKVAHGALGYAKQGNAERVFCGHTHVAQNLSRDGVEYFNTGSWIDMKCTYITVCEKGVRIHEHTARHINDHHPSQEREQITASPAHLPHEAGLRSYAAYESIPC
jgi:UDP-2,3-diacylglucosamine pyrophosphatase LpxH